MTESPGFLPTDGSAQGRTPEGTGPWSELLWWRPGTQNEKIRPPNLGGTVEKIPRGPPRVAGLDAAQGARFAPLNTY
jgi:hypothetical protein